MDWSKIKLPEIPLLLTEPSNGSNWQLWLIQQGFVFAEEAERPDTKDGQNNE